MLQGFGATDACGAGCAQHWIAHSVLHVRLCLPAHFASVTRLTSSIAYMQAIELGTKHSDCSGQCDTKRSCYSQHKSPCS